MEDFVAEDNPVRVIEAFVEGLNLGGLGFCGVDPKATGRPAYHPSILLKLYIYGYLNWVQSSRRLEREAGRNVEVMWLTGRLVPDHKTVAGFRKDNGAALRQVCAQFVVLCRRLGLLAVASVAIDGSKFKAVNNRDRNFTAGKMMRRVAQIEDSVARYLDRLESADRQAPTATLALRRTRLKEKIAKLGEEMKRLEALEVERRKSLDQQISLTDPDARSMATSGRGSGVVGHNVQTAVETDHHLTVAHEVVQTGSDRAQLVPMAEQAKDALGVDALDVVADRGYFSSEQLLGYSRADITVTLPKPMTSGMKTKGQLGKHDFRYVADKDVYICPAGQTLSFVSHKRRSDGLNLRRYATTGCRNCALKTRCTTSTQRVITRWEHEEVLEAAQRRLDENQVAMRQRRETVAHPFGTIKARMGATHSLMRQLKNVRTEMALDVLAYNLTRVMNILGAGPLIQAIRA